MTVGTLAAGERTHLSIDVRVEHGHGSITVIGNCAAVYSTTPSPNVANNQSCATTVARSPSTDVSVVKEGPATAPAGGTIEYSITVTNHGPLTATDAVVRDPIDQSLVTVTALPRLHPAGRHHSLQRRDAGGRSDQDVPLYRHGGRRRPARNAHRQLRGRGQRDHPALACGAVSHGLCRGWLTAGGSAEPRVLEGLDPRDGMGVTDSRAWFSAAACEGVFALEGGEFYVEARVERRGQRSQRSQREVLPAAQDLADPPRRDAHTGREVGSGQAAFTHIPVDIVRQARDESEHLFVDLRLGDALVWRNAKSEAHQCLHFANGQTLLRPDGW